MCCRRLVPDLLQDVPRTAGASGDEQVSWEVSFEQQIVDCYSEILREKFPVLRKSRNRTSWFLVTLYIEVVDNTTKPISDLFLWGLDPVGVLMKRILIELFQEPDIAPAEMCMVLAALLALSETFFLGMYRTSQRGECPMRLPYRRPPISDFYQWVQEPSSLHLRWDVIETLISSFQTVFDPREDDTTVPAMHKVLDSIKPATEGSPVPKEYYQYWRIRRKCRSHTVAEEKLSLGITEDVIGTVDVEEVVGTMNSRAVRTKDVMNAIKYSWQPQGQGGSCLPIDGTSDDQSITNVKSVQQEPPPAYLLSSPSNSHDKRGEQDLKTDMGNPSQQRPTEESSQNLGRWNVQGDPMGQSKNSTKKTWLRRFVRKFLLASGS